MATGEAGTGFRGLMMTRFKARLKLGDREYSELRTGLAREVGVSVGVGLRSDIVLLVFK